MFVYVCTESSYDTSERHEVSHISDKKHEIIERNFIEIMTSVSLTSAAYNKDWMLRLLTLLLCRYFKAS